MDAQYFKKRFEELDALVPKDANQVWPIKEYEEYWNKKIELFCDIINSIGIAQYSVEDIKELRVPAGIISAVLDLARTSRILKVSVVNPKL